MRKSFFTLIEMMISLSFLVILLGTLFGWYRHITLSKIESQKVISKINEEKYLDLQLAKILPKASGDFFFTSTIDCGNSLVFTFDNGAQTTPELSGLILGRLFLDSATHTLCLGLWPKPETKKKTPSETRVLLENVERLDFSFYFPPDPFKLIIDPEKVKSPRPKEKWQEAWLLDYHELPPMMKVRVMREGKWSEYSFDLPQSSACRILYKEGF